jgi:NYN domain
MRPEASGNVVALYWDFENIHASLYDLEWAGNRTYNQPSSRGQSGNRFAPQDVLVNIKAVVDYARGVGNLLINRAYNNWQWFSRYRDELNRAGIDLIQIYPKGNFAKNGADIRLALDVLEDIYRHPMLTHVVIVSSDSDFISLAQKLRQQGRTVVGVGVEQATNSYWAQCCDEFRYYHTLPGVTAIVAHAARGQAAELAPAPESAHDPAHEPPREPAHEARPRPAPDEAAPDEAARQDYELILKRGNLRPLPAGWWRAALPLMEEIFREASGGKLDSFDYLESELCARLGAAGFAGDRPLVHKLRGNLFSLWLFKLDKENQTIGLNLPAGESLLRRVEREMARRIVRFAAPPVNVERLAAIIYGDEAPVRLEDARELIEHFEQQRRQQQEQQEEQERQDRQEQQEQLEGQRAAREVDADAAGVRVAAGRV